MTSEHLRTGKEYDAALIWTEDVTKDSFKVCLHELQNFDGKHEDINVVCDQISKQFRMNIMKKMTVPLLEMYEAQNLQHFLWHVNFNIVVEKTCCLSVVI